MQLVLSEIVVTDEVLFLPGGDVYDWAHRVAFQLELNTTREAPYGGDSGRINKTGPYPVGSLKASIVGDVDRIGPRAFDITVTAFVPYAVYVARGTHTIFARDRGTGQFTSADRGMFIPANPGWGPSRWRQHVRGQAANNFFERGYERTALTHPALRGAFRTFI